MSFKPSHYQHAILCIIPLLKEPPTEDNIRAQLTYQLNEEPDHPDNPKLRFLTTTQADLAGLKPAEVATLPKRFKPALSKLLRKGYLESRDLTDKEKEVVHPPFLRAYQLTGLGQIYVNEKKSSTPPSQRFDADD